MRRILWGVTGLIALAVCAIGAVQLWLTMGVPPLGGRETVPGLADSVVVLWDSPAVPQLSAGSANDLFTALGYLHARDRPWQMDLLRHAAEGRLSELFGPRTIQTDRTLRSLELGRLARAALGTPDGRRALEAYARGVSAWIARVPQGLEFWLLRHAPEPYCPEHSTEIGLLQAWDFRTTSFMLPAGQSGHPFSLHDQDRTARWLTGELWILPLDLRKVKVLAGLLLVPEGR